MNKTIVTAVAAAAIGLGVGYYGARQAQRPTGGSCHEGTLNEQECALRRGMEKLWAEHVVWTRQFIVSAVAGLADADAAAQRLLKNQDDIGNAIVPFYGKDAGAQLTKLLKEHIMIAADIVKAAIAKDNAKVKTLDKQWHANADELAAFLSGANPYWGKQMLTDMFYKHLALTTKELQYRLKGDWKADISNYDQLFEQARMMGKDLADGIIEQFPEKF